MTEVYGLSPEERRWLDRKARLVGGLDSALRLLVRNGRISEVALVEWEAEEREHAAAAGSDRGQPIARGAAAAHDAGRAREGPMRSDEASVPETKRVGDTGARRSAPATPHPGSQR